ncbi:putative F-box domain, leucine-rich repeat domain, L domain-containing protein [Medicago truncatula]|uniref:Putative F-box domain, leucine-rich repeat domain, L domain-containing protein n=1 Tax=Medicago truncatula TaxID=3880 RepID=A0A396HU89_MEDTR|nr:putative F-box domain, leucine-rich repeat domain, L domain-containing protein [Medicago truncatula]
MMASYPISEPEVETENTNEPNWLELPRDVTTNIFRRLNTFDVVTSVCQVCPLWWNICKDPFMWRSIRMTDTCSNRAYMEKICHNAVGRSCVVGQYCPLLKSLKYEKITDEDDDFDIEDEAFAFSVAETMSGLRRLKISSNVLTTDGVLAILDGCPLLECLDIQECRYLFLSFSLEKMCHERIKEYFRLPDFYAFCASDDDYYEDLLPENWNGSVYGDHNLSMMLKHD